MIETRSLFRLAATSVLLAVAGSVVMFAQGVTLTPVTVSDLSAENAAYYSLQGNKQATGEEKAAGAWDIGFQGTTIMVNGSARFVDQAFDALDTAPEDGYKQDDSATGAALAGGSGSGWYYYDMDAHVLTPVPDRTIVLQTKNGKYAKVEIIDYYKGGDTGFGEPRFYTFRFAYQPDGSRNLASEGCSSEEMECSVEQ